MDGRAEGRGAVVVGVLAAGVPRRIPYTAFMTQALEAAIAKLATLPPEEQDRLARWLLDELEDDAQWEQQFGASPGTLSTLAADARAERKAGQTTPLDPEHL